MQAGQILGGRYELIHVIGAGGSAMVWQAQDRVLSRVVAVKVLAGRHAEDPVSRMRVHREARAAAALTHPNIAQIYDFGETDDDGHRLPFVVMELVRGRTLAERMMAGPLPPQYALRTAAEVAAALVAAHAADLVHRDIKPANVLVTEAGAKVVDFGIATMTGPAAVPGPDDDVMGTPAYVAPERLTGGPVTPASDMYALGVLLYRLLSGHSPWDAETTTQMLSAHVHVDPVPLGEVPGVPAYVIALCNRCLSKDPTDRPTARDAAAQLAKAAGISLVRDETPPAAGPPPVLTPAAPAADRSRRRRAVAAVIAVTAAGLLAAGLGAWTLRPSGPDDPGVVAAPFGSAATSAPASAGGTPAGVPPVPGELPTQRPAAPAPPGATTGTTGPAGNPAAPAGTTGPADPPAGPETTTAGPGTTPPTTTTTTAAPPPAETTLSSTGGTVRARCPSAGTAQLTSWTAKKPYKLASVDAGPAASSTAAFKHGNRTVTMTVTCSGGVPSTANDES